MYASFPNISGYTCDVMFATSEGTLRYYFCNNLGYHPKSVFSTSEGTLRCRFALIFMLPGKDIFNIPDIRSFSWFIFPTVRIAEGRLNIHFCGAVCWASLDETLERDFQESGGFKKTNSHGVLQFSPHTSPHPFCSNPTFHHRESLENFFFSHCQTEECCICHELFGFGHELVTEGSVFLPRSQFLSKTLR